MIVIMKVRYCILVVISYQLWWWWQGWWSLLRLKVSEAKVFIICLFIRNFQWKCFFLSTLGRTMRTFALHGQFKYWEYWDKYQSLSSPVLCTHEWKVWGIFIVEMLCNIKYINNIFGKHNVPNWLFLKSRLQY